LNPLHRSSRFHVDGNINVEQLSDLIKHFEGTHDFRAFAGALEANERKDGKRKGTIRRVFYAELVDEGEGNYRIDFLLKGALYKMVRNMVGTALEVCRGRMTEVQFLQLLHHSNVTGTSKNLQFARNDNKSKPAPPEGKVIWKRIFFFSRCCCNHLISESSSFHNLFLSPKV